MKFYPRDPDRALNGMAGLTLEQIGAYNLIIDLLYARDGVVPDDDVFMARILKLHLQRWRRLKNELMAAGKIRVTLDGLLTANGVETTRKLASIRSVSARNAATSRWDNYRKAKQINDGTMRARNASKYKDIKEYSSTSSEVGAENAGRIKEAGEKSTAGTGQEQPSKQYRSPELAAVMRAKGWIP